MNFYKHHLGDYDGATAHLSWVEDMAYTRLLRAYYRREKGFADESEACRLVRAVSRPEKEAVKSILSEFFTLHDDGWHNKRADEEVSAYQRQASTNRRIARERTVQRNDDEPFNEPSTNRTPATSGKREPNHKPEPEPEETKSTALSGKPDAAKRNGHLKAEAEGVLSFLNEKTGCNYRAVPANLDLIVARLKEGATLDEMRAVVERKCSQWSGDDKMAEYLRPATLFNRTKFAQYQGERESERVAPRLAI